MLNKDCTYAFHTPSPVNFIAEFDNGLSYWYKIILYLIKTGIIIVLYT